MLRNINDVREGITKKFKWPHTLQIQCKIMVKENISRLPLPPKSAILQIWVVNINNIS